MSEAKRRSDVIDAFRGVAILVVLLYHYLVRWTPPLNPADVYGYAHVFPRVFALGEYGVHIFFVISGLVIAMTVVKSGSAADFAVRRFARLYPAYLVATTLVALGVTVSGGPFHVSLKDYLTTLTMAAPHLGGSFVDGAYWSLLVEVKFYVWTGACFVLLRRHFWIGLIALGMAGVVVQPFAPRVADQVLLARTLPLFLLGMAGWYHIFHAEHRTAAILAVAGLVLYAISARLIVGVGQDPGLVGPAHAVILGGAAAMLAMLRWWPSARLGPLAYLGRASYSWYLVHQRLGVTLIALLTTRAGAPDFVAITVATLATVVLAALMFEFVEKPCQRLILSAWRHGRAHLLGRPRAGEAGA